MSTKLGHLVVPKKAENSPIMNFRGEIVSLNMKIIHAKIHKAPDFKLTTRSFHNKLMNISRIKYTPDYMCLTYVMKLGTRRVNKPGLLINWRCIILKFWNKKFKAKLRNWANWWQYIILYGRYKTDKMMKYK